MKQEELKGKILQFFSKHNLGVISTIDVGGKKPESAVVAFAETKDLKIIFGSSNKTRKYKNLQRNPNVSFVIGWDSDVGTVQYEGVAKELSKEESGTYSAMMAKKNPRSEKFIAREDQRYFLVVPTWVHWLDMTQHPDKSFEIFFD